MLEVKNVTYTYTGKQDVLHNVTARFGKGNLYCIEGQSGSGKTTLLSLISGLDRVKTGDITIDNESLKGIDLDQYRSNKIGVVFQSYNLLMQLTALDNVLLSMYISKIKKENPVEFALGLLASIGIEESKARRKVIELSGGEQQRVAIARALSHEPDYLFADEPTGNLDASTEKMIMELFQKFSQSGKCVVIVTHSPSVITYADQVYQMNAGCLNEKEGEIK